LRSPYAYAISLRLPALVLLALALAPAAAKAQTPPPIVVADPLSGKFSERPKEIAFRDTFFAKLHWRGWGSRVAVARGQNRVLVCRPSCADGHVTHVGSTVTVSRPITRDGRLQYSCLTWRDDRRTDPGLPRGNSLDPVTFERCTPPPGTGSAGCAGIELGFTTALVSVKNTGCKRGLEVLNAWFKKPGKAPPPSRIRVKGFTCDFKGTDELLTLRCKRGRRVATARWGG
jgi:hypothetical protein